MEEKIHVFLVDDSPSLRAGLRQIFQQASDVTIVGEAGDGKDALALIGSLQPDVVVLDCWLPDMKGTEIAAAIQSMCLPTNGLAFSVLEDEEHVRRMLDAGAVGYLLKSELPEKIIEAVRATAIGQGWFSQVIAAKIAAWIQTEQSESPKLTERELAVLRLLAQGKSNQQIAAALCITGRTLRFHLRNIYDKIGVFSDREAIVWAIQHKLGEK